MDPVRFDTLARTLATTGTRRRLLRLLAAVPVAGGVLSLFDAESIAGNGREGRKGNKGGKGGKGKSRKGGKGSKGGKGKDRSRTSTNNSSPPPSPNGAACAEGRECRSGHCVDGVCCNTACAGECDACTLHGSVGTCTTALRGTPCTAVRCGTCDENGTCVEDLENTACCGSGGRCLEGDCIPAYATIPECGGRCACPGCPGDTTPVGPTACTASGVAPCSACDPRCVDETNCDIGEFTLIPNGPQGSSYYCICDRDATCPADFEPVCVGAQCWPICDDP